jgi:hypothetical protein
MNTTTNRRFARNFALPIVSAGTAGAATTDVQRPSTVATPNVKAHPSPNAMPGHIWHHGVWHLGDLQPSYTR